ncbi:hypothetical protein Pcinc_003735 [Petrolisthes cinctipes]|uniref:Uncharacterized protein n=1 Tax=Petrolisthes cinctipes TaxID=88211 RepID=A0AAE1GIX5_PETCI|nr:hypothetical protein Pcinc_003735 [Petrolisthes cinctipes]
MFTLLLTAILLALGISKDVDVRDPPKWKTCPSCLCSDAGGTCYNPDSAPTTCDDLIDMKCKGNGKRDCKCCINCETTADCKAEKGECRPMGTCEIGETRDSTISCGTGSSCTCCVEPPVVCELISTCQSGVVICLGIFAQPASFCGCPSGEACCITKS